MGVSPTSLQHVLDFYAERSLIASNNNSNSVGFVTRKSLLIKVHFSQIRYRFSGVEREGWVCWCRMQRLSIILSMNEVDYLRQQRGPLDNICARRDGEFQEIQYSPIYDSVKLGNQGVNNWYCDFLRLFRTLQDFQRLSETFRHIFWAKTAAGYGVRNAIGDAAATSDAK